MIAFDVNVFVYALDPESPRHAEASRALEDSLAGSESVVLVESTLVSTARIVTHRRLMARPLRTEEALQFCAAVRAAPRAVSAGVVPKAWDHFARMVSELGLRGGDLTDAWLAAQAVALRARFVTFDRGFRRFPGLQVTILGETTQG